MKNNRIDFDITSFLKNSIANKTKLNIPKKIEDFDKEQEQKRIEEQKDESVNYDE